jgi:MFS transporter, putative metabolite:H+ symporter
MAANTATTKTPLTPYQKKLFFFLSVATFFEGYDFFALSQVLPEIVKSYQLPPASDTYLITFINAGTILAYLLVRKADQWGRKRVLSITIVGYTVFSVLSGLAPNVYIFAIAQFIARIFLIGEWAISMVYAAEEFPADRRGLVIGLIQAFGSFGSIFCAGIVPILLKLSLFEDRWRIVYFAGAVPLVLMAFARRSLQDTQRFLSQDKPEKTSFTRILKTPYRKRMLQLALIWGVTYLCTHNAITFWKIFMFEERMGIVASTPDEMANLVGLTLTIASVGSLPLVFGVGKLLDVLGRKKTALLVFVSCSIGVFFAYTLSDRWGLTIALTFGVFGVSAALPVLNAYNAELFPTEYRGDAYAWSNNLLGRIGYVFSPLVIGLAINNGIKRGDAIAATAIFPLIALVLILLLLPETKGRELEDTSSV